MREVANGSSTLWGYEWLYVTGVDPDGDRFIGRVFMGPGNTILRDNDLNTGLMLGRWCVYVTLHRC
jgi:hypothetical protein